MNTHSCMNTQFMHAQSCITAHVCMQVPSCMTVHSWVNTPFAHEHPVHAWKTICSSTPRWYMTAHSCMNHPIHAWQRLVHEFHLCVNMTFIQENPVMLEPVIDAWQFVHSWTPHSCISTPFMHEHPPMHAASHSCNTGHLCLNTPFMQEHPIYAFMPIHAWTPRSCMRTHSCQAERARLCKIPIHA